MFVQLLPGVEAALGEEKPVSRANTVETTRLAETNKVIIITMPRLKIDNWLFKNLCCIIFLQSFQLVECDLHLCKFDVMTLIKNESYSCSVAEKLQRRIRGRKNPYLGRNPSQRRDLELKRVFLLEEDSRGP